MVAGWKTLDTQNISLTIDLSEEDLIEVTRLIKSWDQNRSFNDLASWPEEEESTWLRREVLYSILTEFGTPMNLVRTFKMCLIEAYSKATIGIICLMRLLLRMVWNKDVLYRPHISTLL